MTTVTPGEMLVSSALGTDISLFILLAIEESRGPRIALALAALFNVVAAVCWVLSS